MNLEKALDFTLAQAKSSKEGRIADGSLDEPRGALDSMPMVEAYRGETPVVVAMLMESGTGATGRAARLLAGGFDADILVVTHEVCAATTPINPYTGEEWKLGEMALAGEMGGFADGTIKESLVSMAVNRAGDVVQATQDFVVTKGETNWEIEWTGGSRVRSDDPGLEDGKLPGRFVAELVAYMNEPGLTSIIAKHGADPARYGLHNPEEIRAHLDCAALKMMYEFGGVAMALMLHAERGSMREAVIQESMGDLARDLDSLRGEFGGEI